MFGASTSLQIARAVVEVLEGKTGHPAALATVTGRSGSAPQITGARLLLREDGTWLGTVGGGAIEARVLEACRETLREGQARTVRANLVRDLGMCCGGTMEVFVEYLSSHPRLVIIGGGHIAQALAPMGQELGFRVRVVEDRDDMLEHPNFAESERLAFDADELPDALSDLSPQDYVIVVTRDHARDEKAVESLLHLPHAYLGMIGSRRKVHSVLKRILRRYDERQRPRPDLSRFHAPIGLALGGRTPPEIALSIAAELVARRHGGKGESMNIVGELLSEEKEATQAATQKGSESAS